MPEFCGKSREDANNLLKEVLNLLNNIPREERTNSDYLERNILNYAWLLQTQNTIINTTLLENLIGSTLLGSTRKYLRELVFRGYAFYPGESLQKNNNVPTGNLSRPIKLCDNLYNAISDQLQTQEMYGDMASPKTLLGKLSSKDLLLYLIQDDDINLVTIISNAIESTFKTYVSVRHLNEMPELSNNIILRSELTAYTRIITCPGEWNFILFAYPSSSALDRDTVNKVIAFLSELRIELFTANEKEFPAIQTLFITPAIDSNDDVNRLGVRRRINYMWAFSALRFVISLEQLGIDYEGSEELVAKHFYSIFDQQNSIAFSIQEAMRLLRAKLPNLHSQKKNIKS